MMLDKIIEKGFYMRSPARGNVTMFLFLLFFVFSSVFTGIVALIAGVDLEENFLLAAALGQVVGIFIPFLLYLLFTRQKPKNVLKFAPLGAKNAILVTVISFSVIPMVTIVSFLSSFVFYPMINDFVMDLTIYPFWASFLVVAIFPSLFEEFMIRGAICSEYEGVSMKKASIFSGLFFGIMHMNFHQSVYTGLFGVLYAYLLYQTRSIWAPILLHFINNGLVVVLAYIEPYVVWHDNIMNNTPMFLAVFGGASLVLTPVFVICLRKIKAASPEAEEVVEKADEGISNIDAPADESKSRQIFTWAFFASIGFFVIFAGITEILFRLQ